jgi:hypothetical protein
MALVTHHSCLLYLNATHDGRMLIAVRFDAMRSFFGR